MELVSASKMRKAVGSVLATRPYADLAWKVIGEIGRTLDVSLHPLLRQTETVEKVLVIVIASDRGLAGSYNSQIFKTLLEFIKNNRGVNINYLTIGKKAQAAVRKINGKITAIFTNLSNNPTSLDIRPVTGLAVSDFISGNYDRVYLLYTDFQSALRQIPRWKQLLPITHDQELGSTDQQTITSYELRVTDYEYAFEPSPKPVLDLILPRIVETQVYQAVLEANASEHSARMVAMKNATESAGEMIDDLVFTFNQIRQSGITRELAEIAAARIAIE
jgi:F-type H+-transporting ATPase subunit gamma